MTADPEQSWLAMWNRLGALGDPLPVYRDLAARYAEPARRYHTLAHILDCLEQFEPVRSLAPNPGALEWAIWFHDAIYDAKAKDNEERSAALAMMAARNAGLSEPFERAAGYLVLATRHAEIPVHPAAQLMVDIDLSILGRPAESFDAYERQVREEYSWVPDPLFAAARMVILKSFLDRPSIYSTPGFRERYEGEARRNLVRSISLLSRSL